MKDRLYFTSLGSNPNFEVCILLNCWICTVEFSTSTLCCFTIIIFAVLELQGLMWARQILYHSSSSEFLTYSSISWSLSRAIISQPGWRTHVHAHTCACCHLSEELSGTVIVKLWCLGAGIHRGTERTTLRTPFESLKLGCPTLCRWIHWHTHAPLLWGPGEPMCSPTIWEEEGSAEKIAVPSHESLQSFLLLHPLHNPSNPLHL